MEDAFYISQIMEFYIRCTVLKDFGCFARDELFMRKIEGLGFNRNHEIVRLMQLLKYVSEKSI